MLKTIKKPLIKNDAMVYPKKVSHCPICNNSLKNGQIVISAGALLQQNNTDYYSISDKLVGFFTIQSHNTEKDVSLNVVDSSKCGQFEFYFCSTKCLRQFFEIIVDSLEEKNN